MKKLISLLALIGVVFITCKLAYEGDVASVLFIVGLSINVLLCLLCILIVKCINYLKRINWFLNKLTGEVRDFKVTVDNANKSQKLTINELRELAKIYSN